MNNRTMKRDEYNAIMREMRVAVKKDGIDGRISVSRKYPDHWRLWDNRDFYGWVNLRRFFKWQSAITARKIADFAADTAKIGKVDSPDAPAAPDSDADAADAESRNIEAEDRLRNIRLSKPEEKEIMDGKLCSNCLEIIGHACECETPAPLDTYVFNASGLLVNQLLPELSPDVCWECLGMGCRWCTPAPVEEPHPLAPLAPVEEALQAQVAALEAKITALEARLEAVEAVGSEHRSPEPDWVTLYALK